MPNLIPEKRLDRNGHLVTRHVLPAEKAATVSLPAPADVRYKTAFKPTDKQTLRWQAELNRNGFHADKELQEKLPNKLYSFTLEVSDTEVYDMLSVLEPHNAVPLMGIGIQTSSEARAFLKERNLDRLVVDRISHAEEALRRRIPAESYLKLCESRIVHNVPLPVLLDAAEVYAMDFSVELYKDVLGGNSLLRDIKGVGAATIRKAPEDVREFIWDLKDNKSIFDYSQIREVLKRTRKDEIGLFEAADLAVVIGADETLKRHSIVASYYMMTHLNRVVRNLDEEPARAKKAELILHYDGMVKARDEMEEEEDSPHWNKLDYAKSIEMCEAGIGPREGWEGVRNGMTVQQILAVRDHGISQSVSSGWL